jgi:hypothetical protein
MSFNFFPATPCPRHLLPMSQVCLRLLSRNSKSAPQASPRWRSLLTTPTGCRDWHGYEKPAGFGLGFAGVGVQVWHLYPSKNLYPSHGYGGFDPISNSARTGINALQHCQLSPSTPSKTSIHARFRVFLLLSAHHQHVAWKQVERSQDKEGAWVCITHSPKMVCVFIQYICVIHLLINFFLYSTGLCWLETTQRSLHPFWRFPHLFRRDNEVPTPPGHFDNHIDVTTRFPQLPATLMTHFGVTLRFPHPFRRDVEVPTPISTWCGGSRTHFDVMTMSPTSSNPSRCDEELSAPR